MREYIYVANTKFDSEMNNPQKENILIVDDEEDILQLITYNLTKEGYSVIGVGTGEKAVEIANSKPPDIIVLDLMLPGIDGLEVCKRLKNDSLTNHIPILMLTAKSEDSDIVIGLELGADDYMIKPFSPKVLTAKIKALLRRKSVLEPESGDSVIEYYGIRINHELREVSAEGEIISLTSTEFDILYFLLKRPGTVYSRAQIVDNVKGDDYPVTDRSVDFHIVSLRKKLGGSGKLIETVRGVGYRFKR